MTDISAVANGPATRLRLALGEFWSAWKRRAPPGATRLERQSAGLMTLALLAGLVAAGYFCDADVRQWALSLPGPVVRAFAVVTRLGESFYVFILTALAGAAAILARGRTGSARVDAGLTQLAARAMFLFCVAAVSGLASQALKHLFGRARPKLFDVVGPFHFDVFSIHATYASFPSGHAVTAFAMLTAISFLSRKAAIALLPLAILVSASRVIIGAHYFSDVLAGVTLGVGSALLIRREFGARGIVFASSPTGVKLRGRGLIWRAVKDSLAKSAAN